MSQTGYLILAISIIIALAIIFVVSFILYKRTQVPKGCEDIKMNMENCSSCGHTECKHYQGGEE